MSGFRRYGRKPLKCSIRILHEQLGDFLAETQDVSESGVFIRSGDLRQRIAVGDVLNAELYSEEDDVANTQLKVVRMTNEGVGFCFGELHPTPHQRGETH